MSQWLAMLIKKISKISNDKPFIKPTKVDADESSNEWWRSDQEEELVRLISTPIVEAVTKIDHQFCETRGE
jgi:hypothetical protein